ncbi:MAG: hypothetical protein RJB03_789 [Bacteroidota bacterium]|jgi:hypothetical protein
MKKLWGFFLMCTAWVQFAGAQTKEDEVKKVVNQLFEGMRNADSVSVLSVFAPNAIMQTVSVNKEGKTIIRQDQVNGFASFVGKQKKGAADEQIVFESIRVDGDLATAWTPYRFVYNGTFSHCGVNSFTLVRLNGEWKINYLIDTRRKEGCN